MKVLGCFGHAFVINLPKNIRRLEETKKELSRHKIPFERLDGVSVPLRGNRRFRGCRGCSLAHLSAVRLARERRYESIAVIEDDVILRDDFNEIWRDVQPQVRGLGYDLLFFYQWSLDLPLVRPVRLVEIEGTLCTHLYCVHRSFYDTYIRIVEEQIKSRSIEHIDRMFRSPVARIYATSYNLAGQRAGLSDISHSDREGSIFCDLNLR